MKLSGRRILGAFLLGAAGAGCSMSAPPPVAVIVPASAEVVETKVAFNGALEDYARLVRHFFGVVVVYENDTRILVLKGRAEDVEAALKLIDTLEGLRTSVALSPTETFTKHLQHARAEEVAKVFESMIEKGFFAPEKGATEPPIGVVAIPATNVIWVRTNGMYADRISGIIYELDRPMEPATQPQKEIRIINGVLVPEPIP